jgi:tetratricopeptide (TPR) repeat protein
VHQLSFQVGRIDALARSGRVDQAVAEGSKLADALQALDQPMVAARVYLSLGNTLLWQERFTEAMTYLKQARLALSHGGSPTDLASAALSLSTANLYAGSLKESRRLASEARARFLEFELSRYADLAAVNLAHVSMLEGRPDQALDLLLELSGRNSDDSTDGVRLREYLGDSYARLNMWTEALDSYESAFAHARMLPPVNVADCIFGIGQALAAEGDRTGARSKLRQAYRRFTALGSIPWASLCLASVSRSYLEEGKVGLARTNARQAYEIAKTSGAPFARLQSAMALAEALAQTKQRDDALFDEIRQLVKRHGYISEAWRIEYLHGLLSVGQARLAAFRRMFQEVLRGRLLTTSIAARSGFLRDKQIALRDYILELVSVPKPARVKEALRVVEQSRAVALLDEIATARTGLDEGTIARIEELRAELNEVEASEASQDGARRVRASSSHLAALQRKWSEATRSLVTQLDSIRPPNSADGCAVLVEADPSLLALQGGKCTSLDLTVASLRKEMRWLEFELMSPLTNRDADPEGALSALRSLASKILDPWLPKDRNVTVLSPDGHLWRVPWQACAAVGNMDSEIVLAMHPSCRCPVEIPVLGKKARVAVWASRSEDLPFIEDEVNRITTYFPEAEVCWSAKEVRSTMTGHFDLIHIAAHASHCNSNPMFSFFELSGERVYATEVAQAPFSAGACILSACETGSLSFDRKDEPDGLARAFLARGASAVVGSAWRLDDEAASLMMEEIYSNFSRYWRIMDAVRSARKVGRSKWEHPYFWAPLVVFGGYGK